MPADQQNPTPATAPPFLIGGELPVHRLGFGAMRLPTGPEQADRRAAIAVARRAVELGVTLIDTAHLYGWGANEELLAEALHPYPDDLLVTTKVGVVHTPDGGEYDARPESLRVQVDEGLRRLRIERVGLLQLHRLDPKVPIAEQVGALDDLRRQGKIGHIGLSEVTAEELAEARRTAPIASVQNRYNLIDRAHEPVLQACEAAGIAFLPWRPVAATAETPAQSAALDTAAAIATELGASTPQVLLAWLLARSPVILPIPGTASLPHLEQNVAAAALHLTEDQRRRLDESTHPAP
ncbi:aldo/keto reductase [Streptomyces sp. NPDC046887]|uniref:aldo/keto reductase n=1 Tax=Streptomyces sp. NPDC046887 TaxID=3155472 RepID=UPI003406DDE3